MKYVMNLREVAEACAQYVARKTGLQGDLDAAVNIFTENGAFSSAMVKLAARGKLTIRAAPPQSPRPSRMPKRRSR